ncbi:MAG: hypothetical protein IJS99_02400 [Synergistaceae bacterium]|nr:hypothetical protein [Synergistaceae bacterium]
MLLDSYHGHIRTGQNFYIAVIIIYFERVTCLLALLLDLYHGHIRTGQNFYIAGIIIFLADI